MPAPLPSSDTASVLMSGKKLVKAALRKLGALDPDQDIEAADLETGKETLNLLLDSANAERLLVYAFKEETLSTSARAVTIGPGGTLDIVRPSVLKQGQVFIRDSSGIDTELRMMTRQEWAAIAGQTTTTGRPSAAYYEPKSPLGIIHFDVTPDVAYTLVVWNWTLLSQISNMTAEFRLPPGYFRWLVNDLALDLAPEYPSQTQNLQVIAETARQAKAVVKRLNNITPNINGDVALAVDSGCNYDIYSE